MEPLCPEMCFTEVKFDIFGRVNGGVSRDADETEPRVPQYTLSAQKVKDLGLNFQPIEEVIHETVTSFKECGWLA
jgi:hypothetical protein